MKKDIEQAWEAYYESTQVHDIEKLRAEGWISSLEIAERLGVKTQNVTVPNSEKKKFKVRIGSKATMTNFFRLK